MSLSFLQAIGLTETEATLYELLLKLGEVSAGEIIREAGMKRPTVYKALETLEKKGLVSSQDKNKKIHFRPLSPTKLLEMTEMQYQKVEAAKNHLHTLLPTLNSSYTLSVEQPITTIDSLNGWQKIYLDTLKVNQPVYIMSPYQEIDEEMQTWLQKVYSKDRIRKKITLHQIVGSKEWSTENEDQNEKELLKQIYIPSQKFFVQQEIIIYGSKVVFIEYKKGEKLSGIAINNPALAQSMKAWFDLAWIGAEKLTSSIT